ncbi:MAG TPA: peptidylprolyl isomerase [Solirubrobacteraceae bacterium]|nr:peptidylprolyl isomerase [Solirubrobacteraceae bacterium]
MPRALAATALVAALALAACGGGGAPATTVTVTTTVAQTRTETTRAKTAAGCHKVSSPPSKGAQSLSPPATTLDPKRAHVVTLQTNCGQIRIELDVRRAPRTTSSFASLVRAGFYDHLIFFRIAAGFVIQAGDPLDNGTGGPGYETVEPPPKGTVYRRGVVAMAKAATQPAGTAGSQFFIVTARDAQLPPDYALVGRVIGSMRAVDRIARTPADASERAMQTILIERATLRTT